jgi:protein-S-isoprenylcysteine O-methyltransferase Ste14
MNKEVGRVEDLKEKLRKGDLTPKQAKKILHERELGDPESWKWKLSGVTSWAAYFILWLLPSLTKQSELEFFARLPAFHFPMAVIYISLALLVTAIVLAVAVHLLHQKWGGLRESGETIIFYRKGLFRIMRHPGVFGFMIGGIALPFLLSQPVTFTPLTVAAIIIWVTFHYFTILAEEKINIRKWGEEYQKYMKEVPRFNFVLGLWRLR